MGLIISKGLEPVPGYKIVKKLGQGGFGEVWEAEAPGGGHVALKAIRLDKNSCADPELRALDILRNVRHPHLLDVQFSVKVDDVLLIAMPLCDQSLLDRLTTCRAEGHSGIPGDELLVYMQEMAKAVDYLNEPRHLSAEGIRIGIQHRDIKPGNIFLAGGSVRLADFGLAKFLGDSVASHTGSMSPGYVAPEALKGIVAQQSDQYSLAVTYCHLRCGKLPITGSAVHELIYSHLHRPPDLSGLPEGERPVLLRALAKEPGARWLNCQEFVVNLGRNYSHGAVGDVPRKSAAHHPIETADHHPRRETADHHPREKAVDEELQTGSVGGGGPVRGPLSTIQGYVQTEEADSGLVSTHPGEHVSVTRRVEDDATVEKAVATPRRPTVAASRPVLPWVAGGMTLVVACLAVALLIRGKGGADPKRSKAVAAIDEARAKVPRTGRKDPPPKPAGVEPTAIAKVDSLPGIARPPADRAREGTKEIGPGLVTGPTRPLTRQVVRFDPPDADVSVDGHEREPDADGRIVLESTAGTSFRLAARAEGFKGLDREIRLGDVNGPDTTLRMEPDIPPPDVLAGQARAFLRGRCHGCHGVDFRAPGLDVLDRYALAKGPAGGRPPYLVPGDAKGSELWQVIGVRGHPAPGPKVAPTEAEKRLLRRWIEAGAPPVLPPRRPFRTDRDTIAAIRVHLLKKPAADRKFQRYFTFTNLHNDPGLAADDLRLFRAALAKLVNSLSWQAEVVVPEPVDPEGLAVCVDLRRLGWEKDRVWQDVLKEYPYGLFHNLVGDPIGEADEEVRALADEDQPHVRADWFVANASRPPLYHAVLRLPASLRGLEGLLGLDVGNDFLGDQLARAGLAKSRVSGQNRVVERHQARDTALWMTYDFRPGQEKGDIFRFPLGPAFPANPFPEFAFAPSGSEVLFQLPNGFLAYMLVDGNGERIDTAPPEMGADPSAASGSTAIVNGTSCLSCHRLGAFPLIDEVRGRFEAGGKAADKVRALYPEAAEVAGLVSRDGSRFADALRRSTGPFLRSPDGETTDVLDLPEPVSALTRRFSRDLTLADVAVEVGVEDVEAVRAKIREVPRLRDHGLARLLSGQSVTRAVWEERFDQVVIELGLGTPHRSF